MKWGRGTAHQRQQIFAVLLLSLAATRLAWAGPAARKGTAPPVPAQSPDTGQSLAAAMDDLNTALQAARLDERTSKAIVIIVNLLPQTPYGGFTDRKSAAHSISKSLYAYARDPDGWDATGARNLDNAGAAVAAAFHAADGWINSNQYYYHVDLGRETLATAATTIIFRDKSVIPPFGVERATAPAVMIPRKQFHDQIADPELASQVRSGHPHYEIYFSVAIDKAHIPDAAEGAGPRFKAQPDGLAVINLIQANPGIETLTAQIALIEFNGRAGDETDGNHVALYKTSVDFEYRKARNLVPRALKSPYPIDDVLARDIAKEAGKFTGPNFARLTNAVAALAAHASLNDNGAERAVTREDVSRILNQLRTSPNSDEAATVLRSWLRESVDYQLRHPQAAAH
jgi:hypothetical protein